MLFFRSVLFLIFFLFLTLLTQVGGIIWLAGYWIFRIDFFKRSLNRSQRILFQTGWYLFISLLIIPFLATLFGRVPMPLGFNGPLKPRTLLTVLCNRHYVRPQLRAIVSEHVQRLADTHDGLYVNYLDANFPFSLKLPFRSFRKGFPLLPHLSHNDGRKLDIAFVYRDAATGKLSNGTPSGIGYGISEEPLPGEYDRPKACRGSASYSFIHDHWPQGAKADHRFDPIITRQLISGFARDQRIVKILLEPHLTQRLSLDQGRVKPVQCGSVRHDDHVHIQI